LAGSPSLRRARLLMLTPSAHACPRTWSSSACDTITLICGFAIDFKILKKQIARKIFVDMKYQAR
jgi:hypothetical protein